MGRTANESQAQAAEPAAGGALEVLEASTRELATLQADQASKAIVVAQQIGYEGSLSVGALEDEIRFYQRRSVESLLEAGKRLVVLRELCQFGTEFDQRVELLGFSRRTAYRFMQAAVKTSKSTNLLGLASQVKNASAFLELVTHDDDVLDGLKEMDEFDRMSASQLRQAARELEADKKATEQIIATKNKKLDELARKSKRFNVHVDLPEEFAAADALASGLKRDAIAKLKALREIREQAMGQRPDDEEGQKVHDAALGSLAVTMRDAFLSIEEELARSMQVFNDTLGMFLSE